ncbi:MAG: hypothetical protein GVY30_08645 [Chloroflexi bacterium]|nr:hypothetical protein [Chloroflexota bacterium]
MSDTMLVTYATRYGSTREVAERIAATLREEGFYVADKEGPLKEGELERAVNWAKQIEVAQ